MDTPTILILVDGMRPDALLQAKTPVMQSLMRDGLSSVSARTCFPSVTLPCIMSIFHSVPPEDHSTIGNLWNSSDWYGPGLLDLYHEQGKKTAAFYNWEQLRDLARPGAVDFSLCLNNSENYNLPPGQADEEFTALALPLLARSTPDLTFFYLGGTDCAGHTWGWMSPEYIRALECADACIGRILNALLVKHRVVIASDHGGHEHNHGSADDVDMTVPLILNGEGLRPGALAAPVSTLDIAPTIAALAGLPIPSQWKGKNLC